MIKSSIKTEYLLMLFNRAVTPGSIYISMALLARFLPIDQFSNYLINMSLAQWLVAAGYQWQKNAAFRYFVSDKPNYKLFNLIFFIVTIFLGAILVVAALFDSRLHVYIYPFIFLSGYVYVISAQTRIFGLVREYVNLETVYTVARWALAVALVLMTRRVSLLFMALSIGLLFLIFAYANVLRRASGMEIKKIAWHGSINISELKKIFIFGAHLIVIDFCGAGLMYMDRFFVTGAKASAEYMVASTIGNQITSVIMGALLVTAYPRITSVYHSSGDWRGMHTKFIKKSYIAFLACIMIAALGGKILAHIVKPGIDSSSILIILFSLSQAIYYFAVLLGLPLLVLERPFWTAVSFFVAILMYLLICVSVAHLGLKIEVMQVGKCIVMAFVVMFLFFVGRRFSRDIPTQLDSKSL